MPRNELQTAQRNFPRTSDGTGRGHYGSDNVFFRSAVPIRNDARLRAVPNLQTDGSTDSVRSSVGRYLSRLRVVEVCRSVRRFVWPAHSSNGVVDVHLVRNLPVLCHWATDESGNNRVWSASAFGTVDALSHSKHSETGLTFEVVFGSSYFLVVMLSAIAALTSRLLVVFLDGVTSWGQAAINGAAMLGAAFLTFGAVWLKVRWDRYKFEATQLDKTHTAASASSVRREELVDKRSDALFDDMVKFYGERDKAKDSIIALMKENHEATKSDLQIVLHAKDELIAQQREVIASQALTITTSTHLQ